MRMNDLAKKTRPSEVARKSSTYKMRVHRRALPAVPRRPLEEKRHRHPKDLGNVLEAAGADAVGSLLVFLESFEGEAMAGRTAQLGQIPWQLHRRPVPTPLERTVPSIGTGEIRTIPSQSTESHACQ